MNPTCNLCDGSVVLFSALQPKLDLPDGDHLILSTRNVDLVATTRRAQLLKAQALFQKFVPAASASAADELMAERGAAADRF